MVCSGLTSGKLMMIIPFFIVMNAALLKQKTLLEFCDLRRERSQPEGEECC